MDVKHHVYFLTYLLKQPTPRLAVTQNEPAEQLIDLGFRERPHTLLQSLLCVVAFRFDEVGQYFLEAPPLAAKLRPQVVIMTTATDVGHAVDVGGAAEHSSSGPVAFLEEMLNHYVL